MKIKAAVLYEYKQPLRVEELDLEKPKEKEVLVEMKSAGLCHSDLPVYLDLYQIGRLPLEKMITQRYRLEDINQGFADMEAGKNARGVIIY